MPTSLVNRPDQMARFDKRKRYCNYQREAGAEVLELIGLVVLSVEDKQIASLVAFLDLESLSSFALPPTLPSSLRESKSLDDFIIGN
jgi:hypothetical protein